VETVCDEETLRERLRARSGAASVSDATEDLLDRMRRELEPITELDAREHVRVRTTVPLSIQVETVRRSVSPPED
jgi:predicted kinase